MNSIEKIYNNIKTVGRMSLATIVTTGKKSGNNDMRRDALYYREYSSQKYSNVPNLDQLDISTETYLGLIYKGYNEEQKFESDEIWMNSKNIDNFKEFIISAYEEISSNAEKIYGKNSVNKEYDDFIIQTGYDENGNGFGTVDAMGHTVFIYPVVCFYDNDTKSYNGIMLGIEDSEGRQFGQEMAISTLYDLASIVKEYNPLMEGRLTYLTSLMYQILNGGVSISSSNVSSKNSSRTLKARPGIKKPIKRRPTLSEAYASNNENDDITDTEEELEETTTTETFKKPIVKATKTNKASLESILNESESIDINLDDEDGEDY